MVFNKRTQKAITGRIQKKRFNAKKLRLLMSYAIDTENLLVVVSDIIITNFSYLSLDQAVFIFEFVVNNTGASALTNVNWVINLDDGTIVESSFPFNLSSKGNIHIYVNHNYTIVGSYDVTANAYDSVNNYSITLSVKTNTTPIISPLPDVTFKEDNYSDTIVLDNYITDEDSGAELTWTVSGNSSDTVRVEILSDRRVNFTSAPNYWTGGINIVFTVTDTDGLSSNDTVLVTVTEQNDPPNITWRSEEHT